MYERLYLDKHVYTNLSFTYTEKMNFIPTPDSVPKRRSKKHPLAPKRPMSAFLKFSISRRRTVKNDNPDMSNTDISRLLGEMWRNAPEEDKKPYKEAELNESKYW